MFKGKRSGKILSAVLESFGWAQTVSIWAVEIQLAGTVAIMVDNSGFGWGFRKGCSR